jgi:hypothetical protein
MDVRDKCRCARSIFTESRIDDGSLWRPEAKTELDIGWAAAQLSAVGVHTWTSYGDLSVDSIGGHLSSGSRVTPADGCGFVNWARRDCCALGYCDCRVYVEICSSEFGAASFSCGVVSWVGHHI